jgi:hypothetical protein
LEPSLNSKYFENRVLKFDISKPFQKYLEFKDSSKGKVGDLKVE